MKESSFWNRFWTGERWGLFFLKFFIFSILAFFVWSSFSVPYGRILSDMTISYLRGSVPILDVRHSDHRGLTVTILLGPADNEILPLEKPISFELHLYPNTLHFNLIPFLAMILATPLKSRRRLVLMLILGSMALVVSHFLHMYLNIKSFYYNQQTFLFTPKNFTQDQLVTVYLFYKKMQILKLLQGFMEQAGSMIMPFLLWIVYAQQWLFRKLTSRNAATAVPSSKPPTVSSPK